MFPPFDPSKMDPKLLMEMSQLIRELPPEQLNRLQSIMHNMSAGYDVKNELQEFEKSLPPGFREKVTRLMMSSGMADPAMGGMNPFAPPTGAPQPATIETTGTPSSTAEMNVREARLTLLRAVAAGQLTPEEAERLLFQE